jgi:malate dehydrogenase
VDVPGWPDRCCDHGAAGQISYALSFWVAKGDLLGSDRVISLRLLEVPEAQERIEGVSMELTDSAFPTLASVTCTSDPFLAFADLVFLVGSFPGKDGMDQADLLAASSRPKAPRSRR